MKANARVVVGGSGCTPEEAVERQEAVSTRVAYRDVPRLSGSDPAAAVVLRDPGMPDPPPSVSPPFGSTALTDRPTLSWRAVRGAAGYRVRRVRGELNAAGGGAEAVWTAQTKEARLPYPEKEKPLACGKTHAWYVSIRPGQEDEEIVWQSQFSVANRVEIDEAARVRLLAASDDPAEVLLAALIYQGYHASDEALAAFERLARLRPGEGHFQMALAHFYARAGRLEESRQALEQAKKLGPPVRSR
jgi:hypothetical protein